MVDEPLGPLDLDRRPTAEMVAGVLRERLLAGAYKPGEPMRETRLATQLHVSRPTAREALLHLVREGLVTHHMHSGMTVTELGVDDVRDLYRVRLALESAGIRRLQEPGETADLGPLRDAHGDFCDAVETNDGLALVNADMGFHGAIVALSASPRLVEFHRASVGQLRLVLSQFDRTYGDLDVQLQEHKKILRAIERERYDDALRYLATHLRRASDNIAGFVSGAAG